MSHREYGISAVVLRAGAYVMALALCVCCFARGAAAVERVDTGRSASLTVQATCGESPVAGMEFSLYRVAEFNEVGAFEATHTFDGCNVDLSSLDHASDWLRAARDYVDYIDAEHIDARVSDTTGATGRIGFTELDCGLYLVRGSVLDANGIRYTPAPYLVSVPYRAEDADAWEYDVTSDVKVEAQKLPAKPASADKAEKKDSLAHLLTLAKTGDTTAILILFVLIAGIAALTVGIVLALKRRKRDE